jgi:NAD(P)-dependent dehydrogenase (short-subunit alcohol dehydrogenase family)
MSLLGVFLPKGPSGFGYNSTAEEVTAGLDLSGKNFLVTGCNSGLGLETSRVLALRGARVLGTARTAQKATEAFAGKPGTFSSFACELSEPASVRACVEAVKREGIKLHGLICNAGIMALPKLTQAHGYELQFFTNHIGHFILVTGLLETLADDGRVVMLSSAGHNLAPKAGIEFENLSGEKGYGDWAAYGQSKLANILMAKQLARKFAGTQKTANAVHPGVIHTNLGRNMGAVSRFVYAVADPIAYKSVAQGAATETYVATNPAAATISGKYFADCNVAKSRKDSDDEALAERLWTESEKIVARVA